MREIKIKPKSRGIGATSCASAEPSLPRVAANGANCRFGRPRELFTPEQPSQRGQKGGQVTPTLIKDLGQETLATSAELDDIPIKPLKKSSLSMRE